MSCAPQFSDNECNNVLIDDDEAWRPECDTCSINEAWVQIGLPPGTNVGCVSTKSNLGAGGTESAGYWSDGVIVQRSTDSGVRLVLF